MSQHPAGSVTCCLRPDQHGPTRAAKDKTRVYLRLIVTLCIESGMPPPRLHLVSDRKRTSALPVLTAVLFLAALAVAPHTVTNRVRRLWSPIQEGLTGSLQGPYAALWLSGSQPPPERRHQHSTNSVKRLIPVSVHCKVLARMQ